MTLSSSVAVSRFRFSDPVADLAPDHYPPISLTRDWRLGTEDSRLKTGERGAFVMADMLATPNAFVFLHALEAEDHKNEGSSCTPCMRLIFPSHTLTYKTLVTREKLRI